MKSSSTAALLPFGFLTLALFFLGCSSQTKESSEQPAEATAAPEVSQDQNVAAVDASTLAQQDRLKQKASMLVVKANELANAGQYKPALDNYEEALRFDASNAEALQGKANMQRMLATNVADGSQDAAANAAANREAMAEKARVYYQDGLRAMANMDYDKAVQDLTMAYQLVKYDPLPANVGLSAQEVKNALDDATLKKDEYDRASEMRRRDEISRIQKEEEDRERKRLERRLQNLWDNAIAKFENEEFERCENICNEIIRLDYQSTKAPQLKEAARRARHALAKEGNIRAHREENDRILQEIKDATIIQTEIVRFTSEREWQKKNDRGDRSLQQGLLEQSEEDREVKSRLANATLPSVNWSQKTIQDVADSLRPQVGVNIIVTPAAKEAATAELNLELKQVTAERALEAACDALSITYAISDGVVKIQTKEESRKNKIIEFYEINDLVTPITPFPGPQLNLSASGVNQSQLEAEKEGEGDPTGAIETDKLIDMIKKAVDNEWDSDDGNKIEPKNGVLIVRQTPEKQRLVRKILQDLRRGTGLQVCIEARFITVENNFLQEIGVDLRGLGNDTAGVGVPGVGRDRTFDDFGPAGTGVGTPLRPLGVGTPSSPQGIGTGTDSGFNFNDFTETDVRARSENLFDERLGRPNVLDETGGAAFQFAYLDDTQLEVILRAVQKYERLNTLHAPKLTVYNTQRANLTVLNEIAYIKDFDVEIAQAAVIADPIVDKIREGVVLDVKPIVSHDRKYVTLELRPTVASLVRPIRLFQTQLAIGAAVTIQLPELHKESVGTTVVVPDNGTLLLGGLKFAEEKTLDSKVPFLGDIPVLSFFFSRTGKYTNLKDLLILVKVKIVVMSELEPGASEVDNLK